jgi:hypothetical protein
MWLDNININLREIGSANMDWIGLAQDRNQRRVLVNIIVNHSLP